MDSLNTDILKQLGFDHLPPEEQERFLERFSQTLLQAILVRSLEILTEPEKEELSEKSDDPDALYEFLNEKIENFDDLVAKEIDKLKSEILSSTKQ